MKQLLTFYITGTLTEGQRVQDRVPESNAPTRKTRAEEGAKAGRSIKLTHRVEGTAQVAARKIMRARVSVHPRPSTGIYI